MNASDFVASARAMLGTPYRHQGRTEKSVDCIGMLLVAGARIGVCPIGAAPTNYGRMPTPLLLDGLRKYCEPIQEPEPGCIVAIRWPGDRQASHVAVCAGGTLIHAVSNYDRVVEHGYRMQWVRWTDSLWWIRGLARG